MAIAQGTNGTAVSTTTWNVLVDAINLNTVFAGVGLNADGSVPLTANWDAGAFTITVTQIISDIAGGTPPIVVTSTTVVPNLNVDKVDGFDLDQALLIASSPQFAALTLGNTGLHLLDLGGDHDLIIKPGTDVSADRTLTLVTGDSDRVITLSGDPTLADWFDQAVKAASSPRFAVLSVNNSGIHILDTDASHDLILAVGSNLSADKTLTLTTGDSDRTITLSGNPTLADWFDQAVKAASSPAFAGITISGAGTIGDGGTTNYIEIADDGFVTLKGTARASVDHDFEPSNLKLPASNFPGTATIGVTPVFQFDASTDQEVFGAFELEHAYVDGSDLHAHFHWAPTDGNSGNVTWGLEWHVTTPNNNEVLTEATTTQIIVDAAESLQDEVLLSGDIVVSGSGLTSEQTFHFRIFRDADASEGGASDTYAADASLVHFDVEIMIDRFGKDEQW